MSRRALGSAAFGLLAVALGIAGYWLLFTSFKTYDDEGYVLLSLANFVHGGRLYGEIYTQYGPFFFWWNDALHQIFGFDFTNTAGRLLTLGYWLGAALLCARIVIAQIRRPAWALLALAATFAHLWQMTAEPGHPGGLIVFLVALAAWGGSACIAHGRLRLLATLVGVTGAALALTKINLGVFLFAGAGAWLLLHASKPRLRHAAPWIVGLALAALPWALMRPLLGQPWVIEFATIAACGAVAAVIATAASARGTFTLTGWGWLLGAAGSLGLLIVGLTLARGTGWRELADGVVLGPLRHPGVFSFAVVWRPGALVWAVVSLAACVAVYARGWQHRREFVLAVACLRLVVLLAALAAWLAWLPINAVALAINFGLPLVWLLIVPLREDAAAAESARLRAWVGLLAVLQALHAYPVGGSQIGWGTFLWAPLLVLASAEAVDFLGQRLRIVPVIAVAAACGVTVGLGHEGWQRWSTSAPLGLPGAENLRLPELLSARLRAFTLNATVHADTLFSMPGIDSFNLWSGRPTPTQANVTHWFSLLNADQQQAIAARLSSDPRAAIVVERDVLRYMRAGGLPVSGPLHDFVYQQFAPVVASGNYELWCHRGRTIAPLSTAHLYRRDGETEKYQLRICVFVPPGARIASIAWLDGSDDEHLRERLVLDAHNCRLEITPLYPNGLPGSDPLPASFPAAPPRFARIDVISNEPLTALPRRDGILRLRDDSGAVIAEAVFAD